MKQTNRRFFILGLIFLISVMTACGVSAQDPTPQIYVENDLNFVDQSMDVSGGIPADAVGVLARIKSTKKLRVATDGDFPPQEFIDPSKEGMDKYAGADMELARLIAKRMGVTLEIVIMDFDDVLTSVQEGECDLAISALAFVPDRAMAVEMSKGYYYSEENLGNGLMIRVEDKERFHNVSDFSESVIAAQSGSLQESIGAENIEKYKEFIRMISPLEVYEAVESGIADCAVVDIETARAYIESGKEDVLMIIPDITFTLEPQYQGDRVAAKKGEIQLMYFVNGMIDEVLESGQYMKWYNEAKEYARSLGL